MTSRPCVLTVWCNGFQQLTRQLNLSTPDLLAASLPAHKVILKRAEQVEFFRSTSIKFYGESGEVALGVVWDVTAVYFQYILGCHYPFET